MPKRVGKLKTVAMTKAQLAEERKVYKDKVELKNIDRMIQRAMEELEPGHLIGELDFKELMCRRAIAKKSRVDAKKRKEMNEKRIAKGLPPLSGLKAGERSEIVKIAQKQTRGSFLQRKFTVEVFERKVVEYFDYADEHAQEIKHTVDYGGKTKTSKKKYKALYSLAGLANFMKCRQELLRKYMFSEEPCDQGYVEIMEWAVSMIEQRILECSAIGMFSPKFGEFLLKNLQNKTRQYSNTVEIEKREFSEKKIEVTVVGSQHLLGGRPKAIENESTKNKRQLGIDVDKIKELTNKEVDIIDVASQEVEEDAGQQVDMETANQTGRVDEDGNPVSNVYRKHVGDAFEYIYEEMNERKPGEKKSVAWQENPFEDFLGSNDGEDKLVMKKTESSSKVKNSSRDK